MFLRLLVVVAVLGVVVGCIPKAKGPLKEYATSLAHFDERGRFWRCNVQFRMSGDELLSECGDPHAILKVANSNDICVAYKNMAHALRADHPHAPFVAVCLDKGVHEPGSSKKFTEESLKRWNSPDFYTKMRGGHVSGVWGLKDTAIKLKGAPSERVEPDSKRTTPEEPTDER